MRPNLIILWLVLVAAALRITGIAAAYTPLLAIFLAFTVGLIPGASRLMHLNIEEPFRYVVTARVNVDGRIYEGQAVQEITALATVRTLPGSGGAGVGAIRGGRGQAVSLDIPGGPALFFLSRGPAGYWPETVIGSCGLNSSEVDPFARLWRVREFTGPCTIPVKRMPTVVRFRDEADPATLELVNFPEPSGPDGNLELVSITVTRSDQPVTYPILSRLLWLTQPVKARPKLMSPAMDELTYSRWYAWGYPQ
jgi:hypothetical protein